MRYKPERALTHYHTFRTEYVAFAVVEMRYKPERALTQTDLYVCVVDTSVEMRYKPERALTLYGYVIKMTSVPIVEMRYKPERALTLQW